jgi:hypothetical protein
LSQQCHARLRFSILLPRPATPGWGISERSERDTALWASIPLAGIPSFAISRFAKVAVALLLGMLLMLAAALLMIFVVLLHPMLILLLLVLVLLPVLPPKTI